MLTTAGFFFRQLGDVLPRTFEHTINNAFAFAVDQAAKDRAAGRPTDFWKTVGTNLFKDWGLYLVSTKQALISAAHTLKTGSTDLRNIERMISSVEPFMRMQKQAEEWYASGNPTKQAMAFGLMLMSQMKWGYRMAATSDVLQGVPLEAKLQRDLIVQSLRASGLSRVAAEHQWDNIRSGVMETYADAVNKAREGMARAYRDGLRPKPPTELDVHDAVGKILSGRIWLEAKELGLPLDDAEARVRAEKNIWGWNEAVTAGFGGWAAKQINTTRQFATQMGIPMPSTNFGNAIGLMMNVLASHTPLAMTDLGHRLFFGVDPKAIETGGIAAKSDPFYRYPEQRIERKIEAYTGTAIGMALAGLIYMGYINYRRKWPKDKAERDLWEANGMRPGQLDIVVGDGNVVRLSATVGPFALFAPWMAAAQATRDIVEDREKRQAKLDAEADARGLPRTTLPPISFNEMISVPSAAMMASLTGGRTASGLVQSLTDYGNFNVTKAVASQISPMVPGLPAMREIGRIFGNRVDERMAGFVDFLLPIPTSGAQKFNLLGDKVGSKDALERLIGTLTGGTIPYPVSETAKDAGNAYRVLFSTGFRPPPIDANQPYAFADGYRPMNLTELGAYTRLRAKYLKAELSMMSPDSSKDAARFAYQTANQHALADVGAQIVHRQTQGRSTGGPILAGASATTASGGLFGLRGRSGGIRGFRAYRTRSRNRIPRGLKLGRGRSLRIGRLSTGLSGPRKRRLSLSLA